MRYKKKLNISSLGAAICNVAVFKGMKERQFKDEIHISYTEDGVILQAANQQEWERANRYVQNFLNNKKISLLAFGFQKQIYEELILKGLKQYTRKMKQHGQECPYINIIHYQKLRKSCQYMDKERYVEPLKDWQRKSKKNPNFAFLIVEPSYKFEQVKRNLLQFLLKKEVPLDQQTVSCIYFLLLFFSSNIKEDIKEAFQKKYLQLSIELNSNFVSSENKEQQFEIQIVNYTNLNLNELDYQIVSYSKHLTRLGLEFIPSKQIEKQIKNTKGILTNSVNNHKGVSLSAIGALQSIHQQLIKQYGQDYCVIPFKKSQRQKYSAVIAKFVKADSQKSIEELSQQIEKNIICNYDDIEFLGEVNPTGAIERGYKMHKACINNCPFLLYEYQSIALNELQTFLMYIDQLRTYYCTYLVRFYGISIRYGDFLNKKGQMPASMTLQQKIQQYAFFLIFDYHHRTLEQMALNDMILDNFQIGQIALQVLYLANFLHTHQEPRALGSLRRNEIYWPLRIVLPYLRNTDQGRKQQKQKGYYSALGEGFEGDVKIVGQMMKELMEEGEEPRDVEQIDDHLGDLLRLMLKESKYERIALPKCITMLQELLLIN